MDFILLAQRGLGRLVEDPAKTITEHIYGEDISRIDILIGLAIAAVIVFGVVAYRWRQERRGPGPT